MAGTPVTLARRRLTVEPATPEALAPMGEMIGGPLVSLARPLDYYNGRIGTVGWVGADDVVVSVARLDRRAPEVRWVERHHKHTQSFLPLGGKPFTLVMAPPCVADMPPVESIRAFRFDGSAGFLMHVGTWHEFPFVEADGTDIVVILRGEALRDLKTMQGTEAHGGDLDKNDLQARLGLVLDLGER
jgi:ureidoglycolate lyase